jgi:hypothetical protein
MKRSNTVMHVEVIPGKKKAHLISLHSPITCAI